MSRQRAGNLGASVTPARKLRRLCSAFANTSSPGHSRSAARRRTRAPARARCAAPRARHRRGTQPARQGAAGPRRHHATGGQVLDYPYNCCTKAEGARLAHQARRYRDMSRPGSRRASRGQNDEGRGGRRFRLLLGQDDDRNFLAFCAFQPARRSHARRAFFRDFKGSRPFHRVKPGARSGIQPMRRDRPPGRPLDFCSGAHAEYRATYPKFSAKP